MQKRQDGLRSDNGRGQNEIRDRILEIPPRIPLHAPELKPAQFASAQSLPPPPPPR